MSDQEFGMVFILMPLLADMNQEGASCVPLLNCTTNALDVLGLQKLIISAQHANIEVNIEYAVER